MYLTIKRALVITVVCITSFFAVVLFTGGCNLRDFIQNPPTTLDGATNQELMDEILDRGLDRLLGD